MEREEAFLADLFEFELCELCGRDAPDHFVWYDALGLPHTGCREEETPCTYTK